MYNVFSSEDESLTSYDFKGFYKQEAFSHNEEILFRMLDLAIDSMVENEDCSYCCNTFERFPNICENIDLCKSALFEGIKLKVCNRMKGFGENYDKESCVK